MSAMTMALTARVGTKLRPARLPDGRAEHEEHERRSAAVPPPSTWPLPASASLIPTKATAAAAGRATRTSQKARP